MKARKLITLVAAVVMLASLLTACATPAATPGQGATVAPVESTAPSAAVTEPANKPDTIENCLYVSPGNTFPEQDKVLAEVNKKMQADGTNVAISFKRIPWDGFQSKLNLMLSSGEEFDMMHVMQDIENLSVLKNMNAIIPIDQYLSKYPDLVSKFTDFEWSQGKVNGETYAVPARWQEFSMLNGYLFYREDVFKKVDADGVFPTDFQGFFDLCVAMQQSIKEETGKTAYMWVHQVSSSYSWLHRTYDNFPFFVDLSNNLTLVTQDGKVESYFESETFKKDAAAYRKMYEAGLIDPDVLNADPQKKYDALKVGAALPSATFSFDDEIAMQKNLPNSNLAEARLAPDKPWLQYCSIQNLNAMSATSKNPEAGLKFLTWLYADKANHDLFCYGIKDVTYTATADNRVNYIKGADNNNLYGFDTWMIGYLPYMRWDELSTQKSIDFKTKAADSKDVVLSPVVGFQFDAKSVSSELANIQAETIASFYPIKYGLVDYESAYPAALEKLKSAGIDKYITEYQTQLTAYLASQTK